MDRIVECELSNESFEDLRLLGLEFGSDDNNQDGRESKNGIS